MAMVVLLKSHVSGYTRKDGTAVRDHWTTRQHADGGKTHSLLASSAKPAFRGSRARYMRVHELPGGEVMSESHMGAHSRHDSVDAAKRHLESLPPRA